jgi:predicted 2-oxoglutarate/Fe(II)-dependent dioxygenase YbiX
MYTLVLEELERQYREQSELFTEDNASLDDIIMKQQGTELGDDRFEAEAAGDQTGWVSGRLTRQLNAQEQQVQREERAEKRIALENAAAATVVSTKNPFNVM